MLEAMVRSESINYCEHRIGTNSLSFFISDLSLCEFAVLVVQENRFIKVKEPLGNLAYCGLIDVWDQLFDYALMLENVLKYFSRVTANKHFEEVAPVATKNRVQLGAVWI